MADHLRKQIRDAVTTALTGLTTTGAHVYASRVYPLQDTELPALRLFAESETSERVTLPAPGLMARALRLRIEAVAKATADLDDTLDLICKEVETALAMPCAALAGLAQSITLAGTEIMLAGTAEQPVGQAAMLYDVSYVAAENAPDVAH
jgi:hypothetical protein